MKVLFYAISHDVAGIEESKGVCFKHAVQLATESIDIETEIDEILSAEEDEYDLRDKSCYKCREEM